MAVRDNIHSRLVFWLKILLPILALAILSTLFLFSRQLEIGGVLPYAEVDVEELARDQRLTAPEYSGMTLDGAALSIRARIARPTDAATGDATADNLVVAYETPDGLRIDVIATEGRLNEPKGHLALGGGVEIITSNGYRMATEGLDSLLDRTEMTSKGAVRATAPYGQIDAGTMTIRQNPAENAGYLMVFNKGVKLIYDPVK